MCSIKAVICPLPSSIEPPKANDSFNESPSVTLEGAF
jgi:hypothetical protein